MNRRAIGIDGPLTLHERGFRAELERRGYWPDAVQWRVRQLRALNRWLGDHRLGVRDVDADCIGELVSARQRAGRSTLVSVANFSRLLAYLARRRRSTSSKNAVTPALHCASGVPPRQV
jgi:hypothetical protein